MTECKHELIFDDAYETYQFNALTYTGNLDDTITVDADYSSLSFPDRYIAWLPYKIEKYIPTWHLVRSYQND